MDSEYEHALKLLGIEKVSQYLLRNPPRFGRVNLNPELIYYVSQGMVVSLALHIQRYPEEARNLSPRDRERLREYGELYAAALSDVIEKNPDVPDVKTLFDDVLADVSNCWRVIYGRYYLSDELDTL